MEWSIKRSHHVAVIDEIGGGLRSFQVDGVDVVDGYPEGARPPGGAGQVLAPWPNRIRDGRYDFEGRTHELVLTEPEHGNAIHGLMRRLPWSLVTRRDDCLSVACEVSEEPGYPFDVRVSTTWSLSDDGLHVEHEAESLGPGPAPFGLGVHPYLTVPGHPADELRLTVPADTVLYADERGLPKERTGVDGSEFDFRTERTIGSTVVDHAYTDLHDDRTVRIAGGGTTLELWVSDAFPWVQVFTADTLPEPRYRRSVAVEPMTCPADAFNSGVNLIRLESGQVWRGSWGIRRTAGG
jgi:aldose 1-epimerase